MATLTVDGVVFGYDRVHPSLHVLLVTRGKAPFRDHLAFPGGHVELGEGLEEALRREIWEETGISIPSAFEQFHTFGDPGRDPRGHVVSVAYHTLTSLHDGNREPKPGSDAKQARWYPLNDLKTAPFAFDHERILRMALTRLQDKARHVPIGIDLLPSEFTLDQLRHLYNAVFQKDIPPLGFALDVAEELPISSVEGSSCLCRFDKVVYERMNDRKALVLWI